MYCRSMSEPSISTLSNKRIIVGISGGIAAYKSAELVRHFKKAGADVRVVMTKGAMEFITPLTLQALSGNPVHHSLLDPEAEAAMGHIELAKWADIIVIAPASADLLARINSGMADDLLSTICLATETRIAIAPAMNQAMWHDEQTQTNLSALTAKGYINLGCDTGEQACGDVGFGRMHEPLSIAEKIAALFETQSLNGKHVVITAGPTREALDPVRYISNHSSGKMGYALAQAAIDAGAKVTLISGPVTLSTPQHAKRVNVVSAQDMLEASLTEAKSADVFIGCAAVADYRPVNVADQKIKKSDDQIQISLEKNPDVIASVSAAYNELFCVGFAAETQNVEAYARGKLEKKGLAMIIANDVSRSDIGFNSDENAVTVITSSDCVNISQCNKDILASKLVNMMALRL